MKRPFLVLVGSVVLSLLSVGASAYDCTSGGEQISITSALFLFGEAPDPNTSQNIVWFEGITSRSPEDAQQCPGWVRIEAWIDGVPGGAVVRQSETWATIGTTNMLDLMHVFVQGSQAITWQGHSKHLVHPRRLVWRSLDPHRRPCSINHLPRCRRPSASGRRGGTLSGRLFAADLRSRS